MEAILEVGEGHVPCPLAPLLNPPLLPVLVEPAPAPHPKQYRSIALPVVLVVDSGGAALIALFFIVDPHFFRTATRYARTATTATPMCDLHAEVDCCAVEE